MILEARRVAGCACMRSSLHLVGSLAAPACLWLGVDLIAWRDRGITPIWSEHNTNASFSGVEGRVRQAEKLFDDAQETDGWLYIPIRLATRAERDRVIDDAVRQMRSIADRLLEAFPDG